MSSAAMCSTVWVDLRASRLTLSASGLHAIEKTCSQEAASRRVAWSSPDLSKEEGIL